MWRFETPYTDLTHPGFCCTGGRFLAIPMADAAPRRLDEDGEVAPELTAERVWPGAFLLASYLQQQYSLVGRTR